MNMSFKRFVSAFMAILVMLALSISVIAADAERISVTINGDAETSRGFCWYTSEKAGTDLQIAPVTENLDKAEIISGYSYYAMERYAHKVVADGLEPGTKYAYRVGDAQEGEWSDIGYFTTADTAEDEANFIVFADVQASNEENFKMAADVLKQAVNVMPEYEFTVGLGDFVNDCTNEEWDSYFRNFAFTNMNTTLVPVAGNHEGNLQWFKFNNMFNIGAVEGSNTMTGCYYSFDWGDAHFAVLNTNDMYPMSLEQINWLRNDMNASDAQWKVVLMHRALFSAGKNINKPDTLIMREHLLPVIDELGIDVVFAGHDHMYFRTESVKNNQVVEVDTVTERYKGEEIIFDLNPAGTTHILPSTSGTKRYSVNEDAIKPILDCGALVRATEDGGVFATVSLDSEHFVYKAYMVDDETKETSLIDTYAIKKTEREAPAEDYENLPTDSQTHFTENIKNLIKQLVGVLLTYLLKLLPQMIF
ncbi:MAG: metallophosphoesterase family protein [Ruminococcaceae bacterium]|nr:metallophosphoesterase family protein [Oscillospiraceae bacterium]